MDQAEPTRTTIPSRRTLLRGGMASAAAIAVPAGVALADTDLFAIEPTFREASARYGAALYAACRAEDAMDEWKAHNPHPRLRDTVDDGPDLRAAAKEYEAATGEWSHQKRAADRACGYAEADKRADALNREVEELADRVALIRATTLEGLKAKARMGDSDPGGVIALSIVDDLMAMQPVGALQ